MSKQVLLEKLTDQAYRDAFISEEIDIGIPMQLRAMREARGWNQKYIAAKMETKQPRFSLMEKPGYGNFSVNTLKKLASIFNVGLIVSFVPFSEMIDFVEGFGPKRLEVPCFGDEYATLEMRYSKRVRLLSSGQTDFKFPEETYAPVNSSTVGLTANALASHDETTASSNSSGPPTSEARYGSSFPPVASQELGL